MAGRTVPLERRVLHVKAYLHTAAGRQDFDRGRPARSRQPRHPDPAEERPSHDVEAIALVIGLGASLAGRTSSNSPVIDHEAPLGGLVPS
jgi:hypothetical protein